MYGHRTREDWNVIVHSLPMYQWHHASHMRMFPHTSLPSVSKPERFFQACTCVGYWPEQVRTWFRSTWTCIGGLHYCCKIWQIPCTRTMNICNVRQATMSHACQQYMHDCTTNFILNRSILSHPVHCNNHASHSHNFGTSIPFKVIGWIKGGRRNQDGRMRSFHKCRCKVMKVVIAFVDKAAICRSSCMELFDKTKNLKKLWRYGIVSSRFKFGFAHKQ